ncbi:MAG: VWA domain-containing protein [Bacteroidia bacterium]|nr:VWA domain-containing protein [Bacteroidia bacterium]MCZ2247772.1 VWA domain-containing protein [Bacteroidia bacterium]
MRRDTFDRFINFGFIGNKDSREKIANAIFSQLLKESEKGIDFANADSDNFGTAIDEILSYPTMKELCSEDPELAEKITQEILDFVNKTKKQLSKTSNPFEEEIELKNEFEQSEKSEFKSKWDKVNPIIKDIYDKKDFDTTFYENEFKRSLDKKINIDKDKPSFESVKEHFIEEWDELLIKKQIKWELEQIETERKKFCEELYKRIEELKKLQEVLEPFTIVLGRIWEMSKGNWQSVNFDILKKYAELLQRDKSLKELAEMLGKMQQAEKEFEEEMFANIQLKPEWKVEHASKADLIGIHESDDLSSLLPSETALLANESMQFVFYKKYAEKKLQTFEYQAKMLSYREEEYQDKRQKEKEEAKGPFIICVDTSGSMHGTPEIVAKTLCFAILKIAIRDNRKCYLISFSTGIATLNLTDLKNSIDKIISFLSMSFQGGTDATPAMREALRMLTTEDYKKADVIMISDFVMSAFDKTTQDQIKSAKDNKTKFHSLVVGNSQNPATIKDFDNNWFYELNNPNSVLTLVKNINEL